MGERIVSVFETGTPSSSKLIANLSRQGMLGYHISSVVSVLFSPGYGYFLDLLYHWML